MVYPVKRALSHRFSRPLRQYRHVPQVEPSHGTPTLSPMANLEVFAPAATTVPTISCPMMTGSAGAGRSPSRICRSVRHTPHAATRSRTWPGPGRGTGISLLTSGRPLFFQHHCEHRFWNVHAGLSLPGKWYPLQLVRFRGDGGVLRTAPCFRNNMRQASIARFSAFACAKAAERRLYYW